MYLKQTHTCSINSLNSLRKAQIRKYKNKLKPTVQIIK